MINSHNNVVSDRFPHGIVSDREEGGERGLFCAKTARIHDETRTRANLVVSLSREAGHIRFLHVNGTHARYGDGIRRFSGILFPLAAPVFRPLAMTPREPMPLNYYRREGDRASRRNAEIERRRDCPSNPISLGSAAPRSPSFTVGENMYVDVFLFSQCCVACL